MTHSKEINLDTIAMASPFVATPDGWKKKAALKTARQLKAYWTKRGAPWVRASVVELAEDTFVVRSNLLNGKPPPEPSWRMN